MEAFEIVCLACNEVMVYVGAFVAVCAGTFLAKDPPDDEPGSEARLLKCPKCGRSVAVRCTEKGCGCGDQ